VAKYCMEDDHLRMAYYMVASCLGESAARLAAVSMNAAQSALQRQLEENKKAQAAVQAARDAVQRQVFWLGDDNYFSLRWFPYGNG